MKQPVRANWAQVELFIESVVCPKVGKSGQQILRPERVRHATWWRTGEDPQIVGDPDGRWQHHNDANENQSNA